jgi:two-component system sensor histidine kinase/response regulator
MQTTIRILVVDDEPHNFDVIATFLESEPYELLYANNAERARQILQTLSPDLILLDVMMPEEDGMSYCRNLRSDAATQHTPVLMVTALDDKESLAACFAAGADDFIAKPVSSLELKARIKAHLRLQETLRQTQDMVRRQTQSLSELQSLMTTALPHELKTPISGIRAPIQYLREELREMQREDLLELFDMLDESTERMHQLVERLLLHLRIEAKRVDQLQLETGESNLSCELDEILHFALQSVFDSTESQAALEFEEADSECAVFGDAELVRQLFIELFGNALKFREGPSPVIIRSKRMAEQVQIIVENTGAAMDPGMLDSAGAFIQFERGKREQQGLGLGLAICKGIVDLTQGATLAIDPNYTQGTRMIVSLQPVDED